MILVETHLVFNLNKETLLYCCIVLKYCRCPVCTNVDSSGALSLIYVTERTVLNCIDKDKFFLSLKASIHVGHSKVSMQRNTFICRQNFVLFLVIMRMSIILYRLISKTE